MMGRVAMVLLLPLLVAFSAMAEEGETTREEVEVPEAAADAVEVESVSLAPLPEPEAMPLPEAAPAIAVEDIAAPVQLPDPEDADELLHDLRHGDERAFARAWQAWPLLGVAAVRPIVNALAADDGTDAPFLFQLLDRAVLGSAADASQRDAVATELLEEVATFLPEVPDSTATFEAYLPGFFGILEAWARYLEAKPMPDTLDAQTVHIQRELLRRVAWVAGEAQVPPLHALLAQAELAAAAARALASIPVAAAAEALLQEMPARDNAETLSRAALLATRHPQAAEELYRQLAEGAEDTETAAAALHALAYAGILPKAIRTRGAGVEALDAETLGTVSLLAAQAALVQGDADTAAQRFLQQLDNYTHQYQIRAALIGLCEAASPRLQNVALAHATAQDLRETVIDVLVRDPAPDAEAGLRKAWKRGAPAMRSVLLEVFARRGVDDLPALMAEAGADDNLELRFRAAQKEGVTLGAEELMDLARNGKADVRGDALRAYLDRAFAEAIEGNLLLAADQFRAVLDGPFPERAQREALEGLGMTGDPNDFERIRSFLYRPAHHNAAAAALIQLAAQNPDPDAAIADIREIIGAVDASDVLALAAGMLESLGADPEPLVLEQGFVTNWRVLGPFPMDMLEEHPEVFGRIIRRRLTEAITVGDARFEWIDAATTGVPATVDLAAVFDGAEGDAAFALTRLPVATWTPIIVNLYYHGGARLWLNGKPAGEMPRGTTSPQKFEMVLDPGVNRLMIQLLQGTPPWSYGVQLTDRRYQPLNLRAQELPEDDAAGIGLSLDAIDRTITEDTP